MALTFRGVRVLVPDSKIPTGYTKPSVSTFNDWRFLDATAINVDKATADDSSQATTFTNIVSNLSTQMQATINAAFDVSNDVVAFADFLDLRLNSGLDESFYTDGATQYVCQCRLYIKSS